MLQRLLALATNTFVETVRQPIYGVLLLATAAMLILNVGLAGFTLEDDDKLLLDLGLNTLMLSGLFLAAFSATGVLTREIENKTVLTVISKPVSRPLFILGKFAGLQTALTLAFFLSFLVFVLAQRHGVLQNTTDPWDAPVLTLGVGSLVISGIIAAFYNYFYGKDFRTTFAAVFSPMLTLAVLVVAKFDEHWEVIPFGSNFVGGQVILAAYLVWLMVTLLSAVALAVSTRMGQLATLVVCTAFLAVGITSDWAFGQHAAGSDLAALAYHLVPNTGPFWVIDGLSVGTEETAITWEYIGYTTAYAALLTTAALSVAVGLFQRREVG